MEGPLNGGLIPLDGVSFGQVWLFLPKRKTPECKPNAFRKQFFYQPSIQQLFLELNHVLPRCLVQSDQTKSPILGGLSIVSDMSKDFQRSLFVLRNLRAQIREPTEGTRGRRRGLNSKGEASKEGRHNRGDQHYQHAQLDLGRSTLSTCTT